MPPRKPAPTNASPIAKPNSNAASRKITPLIPLAIPLAAALLMHPAAPKPAPQTGAVQPPVTTSGLGVSLAGVKCGGDTPDSPPCTVPYPMLSKGHPVNWWFVFKLNTSKFPGCGGGTVACPFGGTPQAYNAGMQYAFASSEAPSLQAGAKDCLGDTTGDPVGATFDEVYHGSFHFVVWNDQFYGDPAGSSCGGDGCDSPWGHSKGMIAWNDAGEGMVMQVSTPSWPGAGNISKPRTGGNTLGCVKDNDVKVSQHFFALRLTHEDLDTVLDGLANASVVTDPKDPQIVNNGGPGDVQDKVNLLGVKSKSPSIVKGVLSSGLELISKPSAMHVPPWQMVSSVLGGVPLRTATWWEAPEIPSTTGGVPDCWDKSLTAAPGAVQIATTGTWAGQKIGLEGGISPDANHAKLGVSTSPNDHFAIFGDMNQQGVLTGKCDRSQNGRGGMFFVLESPELSASLAALIAGDTAPTQ